MLNFPSFFNAQVGGYEIEQSLRFNSADSARLYRTLDASQTRTYSFWYKYANLSGGNMYLFHHKNSGDTNYLGVRSGGSPSENQWQTLNQGASFTQIASSRKYRDPSAWQHVLWKCTSTNVTMYVNGVEFASAGGANTSLSGGTLEIGARGSAEYFGGYIAEFHLVDGSALDPDQFGEYDNNGVWRPIAYTGSHGTNGFYLTFDPSATNGIGHDHSGNGNNFTATGFSTSGTGTDVMSDTPTTNWATLNPLDKKVSFSYAYEDGNLVHNMNSGGDGNFTTSAGSVSVSTGKWYWEVTMEHFAALGILNSAVSLETNGGIFWNDSAGYVYYGGTAVKINNGTQTSYGNTFGNGDIIGIAFDADAGKIWFAKNNTWQASGDPAAGTNAAFTSIPTGSYRPAHGIYRDASTRKATFNFGQRAFAYTPPTGYKALNTSNLSAPTVKDGGDHFNTVLYTGNTPTGQSITGVGFQPDFLWIKARSYAGSHALMDVLRGSNKQLVSNSTNSEGTNSSGKGVLSFNSDGFTLGEESDALGSTNGSQIYVAWNWLAGGTGSSNTDGSITSTVSANPSAGFSIVSYTGNQASTQTVGHGLGVTPSFIIVKDRDNSSRNWVCYHKDLGLDKVILLNSPNAPQTISGYWGTSITSTVFGLPAGGYDNNPTGDKLIAYCFAEVEGYSKFGSYTGNGSSDGSFVYCGFRPAFVILKRTDFTGSFTMWDSTRNSYNTAGRYLHPNSSQQEFDDTTSYAVDMLSNGFKLRTSFAQLNVNGGAYIYMAFSENPFGGANVSPATAR
jgi:hypothetical protein